MKGFSHFSQIPFPQMTMKGHARCPMSHTYTSADTVSQRAVVREQRESSLWGQREGWRPGFALGHCVTQQSALWPRHSPLPSHYLATSSRDARAPSSRQPASLSTPHLPCWFSRGHHRRSFIGPPPPVRKQALQGQRCVSPDGCPSTSYNSTWHRPGAEHPCCLEAPCMFLSFPELPTLPRSGNTSLPGFRGSGFCSVPSEAQGMREKACQRL